MGAEGIEPTSFLLVGTVTVMFIDVECSTCLWESAPEAMGAAVCRHYKLLDKAISSQRTCDLVVDRLPEHAEFIDLGVARVRDPGTPEHVFGLVHPDVSGEFSRWAR